MEFETILQSDLSKPVQVKQLTGNFFSGDNKANKITVELFKDGSPYELTGGISAYVIREDKKTVVIADTQGTHYTERDGNKYSVILPQSAYVVEGQVSIVVKVGTVTVGACTTYVYKSTTSVIVDPGSVIPDISELEAIIASCVAATEDAQTATLAAQSATASANTATNAANSVATYIGGLTVVASTLSPDDPATATLSTESGHAKITFGIPKGESGNETIDDDAGLGDTDVVWSADKSSKEIISLEERERIHESIAVSAPVQTIDDGADNAPMGMKVAVEPIQDLHGYDYPWVGGAGKNLFNPSGLSVSTGYEGGITITNNGDGTITLSGSANSTAHLSNARLPFEIPANTNVTISLNNSTTNSEVGVRLTRYTSGETTQYGTGVLADATNKTATVSSNFIATGINVYVKSNHSAVSSITLKIQVEIGSSATTWSPYENICPISGWDKAEVTRTGKNLFGLGYDVIDMTAEWRTYSNQRLATEIINPNKAKFRANENGTGSWNASYYVIDGIDGTKSYTVSFDIAYNDTGYTPSFQKYNAQSTSTRLALVLTTNNSSAIASGKYFILDNIQVEEGSSATTYEPFGTVYTIPFSTDCYGGYFTVGKDGEVMLTIENKLVTLNGSESWNVHGTYASLFYLDGTFNDSYISERNNPYTLTNKYKYKDYTSISNAVNGEYGIGKATASATNIRLVVKDTNYTTVEQFEASLASSNLQVCYKLATPITVKLNPCTIRSLLGTNNIWADTGNVLQLDYSPDAKQFIMDTASGMIADGEVSMKATKNYSSGDLFTVGATLYKATTSIASGETLTTGSSGNCMETTVADEISAILNSSAEGVSF